MGVDVSGLFIGLVTHPRTHFPDSRGAHGITARLADALESLGIPVSTLVEDRDLAGDMPDLSEQELAQSRQRLLETQRSWATYCLRGDLKLRLGQWVSGMRGSIEPAGALQARRLLNIERAHLQLMSSSLDSESEFTLIIEDDAECSSIGDLALDLHELVTRTEPPYMAHVSTSFSPKELGIENLIRSKERLWLNGGSEYSLLRPVTNTVCATVYRRDFLARVHELWRAEPLVPVIPVDWRLNELLMRMNMTGLLPEGYASLVYPSPVIQRSLHS